MSHRHAMAMVGGRRRRPCTAPAWWCAALLSRDGRAGLTAFHEDPAHQGLSRLQRDVYVPERYLEPDDGSCSTLLGPLCSGLHGRPADGALGGLFAFLGPIPGDPGNFVQDEIGSYFSTGQTPRAEEAEVEAEVEGQEYVREAIGRPSTSMPRARCIRVAFGTLAPHIMRLPRVLRLANDLWLEASGDFAVVASSTFGLAPPAAHVEVQVPIAYLTFSAPVTVEQIWVARTTTLAGHTEIPTVLRGRDGPDEQWSAYLYYADFRKGVWITPLSVTPLPVREIVVLGGQGLRIASIYVSSMSTGGGDGPHREADVEAVPITSQDSGWLLSPMEGMRSLHDVVISRLPLPTAAAVFSIDEIQRFGCMRLRAGIFDAAGATAEALAAAEETPEGGKNLVVGDRVVGSATEDVAFGADTDLLDPPFSDARSVGGAQAIVAALRNRTFTLPRDVPLESLEADTQKYQETFGGVTFEEAVNAQGLDELYERLFTANRMDALDLIFLRFLWANYTNSLAAETNHNGLLATAKVVATAGSSEDDLRRRSLVITSLSKYTSLYARWERNIQNKIKILNASGSSQVQFTLRSNKSVLGIDFYNLASGRSLREDIVVRDAEYLLAELLGVARLFLVDRHGRPLSAALSRREHARRSSLEAFKNTLAEMQQETANRPTEPESGLVESEGHHRKSEAGGAVGPPPAVVLTVSCLALFTVLFAVLAPPVRLPRSLRRLTRRMRRVRRRFRRWQPWLRIG